jgi:hypothetical protein
MSPKRKLFVGAMAALSLGLFAIAAGVWKPGENALPDCESEPVQRVARAALATKLPGTFTLDSFGPVEAESTDTRLVCRAQLTAQADHSTDWVRFSVERHSGDQIFVQFLQKQ